MSVEVIAVLAWTAFVAWVVFLGGAEWLEDAFLGALLLGCGTDGFTRRGAYRR